MTSQSPPSSADVPRAGETLDGKYLIERVVGAGGMGVVLAARHVQLDTQVAIKVLLPAAATNQDIVARFLREGRSSAKLRSDHVAKVLDVGTSEAGAHYLVMELLAGQDLGQLLQAQGTLPVSAVIDWIAQALEALAEAHGHGIVHRDLKPSNLFLARRPDGTDILKILDFGISKATTPHEKKLTASVAMMGSPLYMSPEQMLSAKDVDQRADLWSLGVVMYELSTGRVPFDGESIPQLCARVMNDPVPAPHTVRSDLPSGLDGVILRLLEKDLNRRYQNVGELARDLEPFASDFAKHWLLQAQRPSSDGAMTAGQQRAIEQPRPWAGTAAPWSGTLPERPSLRRNSKLRPLWGAFGILLALVGGGLVLNAAKTSESADAVASADVPLHRPAASQALPSAAAIPSAGALPSSGATTPESAAPISSAEQKAPKSKPPSPLRPAAAATKPQPSRPRAPGLLESRR